MNLITLIGVERMKIRRSHLFFLFLAAVVILWIPSVLNADLNFTMEAEGISPEHSFFIQGFMAMSWFMFPASMVVTTVLLSQAERKNKGLLKMRSLPLSPSRLCLAKFAVLTGSSALWIFLAGAAYFVGGAMVSRTQNYPLLLSVSFVAPRLAGLWLSSLPMLAVFWLLASGLRTPVFSIGLGFASIVPSVFLINTKIWFAYPMAYPLFVISAEYGKLAANLSTNGISFFPWIPAAAAITAVSLLLSCICFGREEKE